MSINDTKLEIKIRKAVAGDSDSLLCLIDALADYEKLKRPDKEAKIRLKEDIFGISPKINVLLAEFEGRIVGYAIYFFTYSSFLAKSTLYLEDVFVLPEYRSKGIGKLLFKYCAKVALEMGCGRMEWQVLDWNKLAIDFYIKSGAKHMKEWFPFRFNREDLEKISTEI